ncbi:MAG TPA: FmdB family zinc ribbon protein [Burkholderiaceae bacterium]|nr:FmdB family zinc ribbon protein [Burkholderiaceae bacterium]
MPIYAYRCERCGHAKDVIQKFSDAPLSTCPECGADAFRKQLTAPAFQLKGSGWYVTDFRDGKKPKPSEAPAGAAESKDAPAKAEPAASPAAPSAPAASPAAAPETPPKPLPST